MLAVSNVELAATWTLMVWPLEYGVPDVTGPWVLMPVRPSALVRVVTTESVKLWVASGAVPLVAVMVIGQDVPVWDGVPES